jgi:uncharacterized protein YbbC (DUF1343 family)
MKLSFFLLFLFLSSVSAFSRTSTGLDALYAKNFASLKGKRIGFICNQTSRTATGDFGPDVLLKSKVNVIAFFSPEHGFAGVRKAGITSDSVQTYQSIPVYSLYGDTRKPTKKMLKGITTLVFDIQDIGVRPYTYLSTMIYAMETAAENNIEFIVLDRPNPLGGERMEGNILDSSLRSFVGILPIPYIHSMTLGELARMAKGERWIKKAEKLKLEVIKMESWKRSMTWEQTGLKWTAPSPNIPTYESAVGCAMFGALGELGIISVGIGSDTPFLRIGSRLLTSDKLFHTLRKYLPKDIELIYDDFTTPFGDTVKSYNGIKVVLPSGTNPNGPIYSAQFSFLRDVIAIDTNIARSYGATSMSSKRMFDKVVGTHALRRAIESGNVEQEIGIWQNDCISFWTKRTTYLFYR